MSRGFFGMLLVIVAVPSALAASEPPTGVNPAIDMQRYLIVASEAATAREAHRLSEQQFIEMSRMPGVVILDARSRRGCTSLPVRGQPMTKPALSPKLIACTLPMPSA